MTRPAWWDAWYALCDAAWRDCHLADEGPATLYAAALADLPEFELCQAVFELVKTETRMPTVAQFRVVTTRLLEAKSLNERARIAPPQVPVWRSMDVPVEDRLAEFDDEAQEVRLTFRMDARDMAKRNSWAPEQLARVIADDEIVGPYELRARELVAGGVSPGDGIKQFLGSFGGPPPMAPQPATPETAQRASRSAPDGPEPPVRDESPVEAIRARAGAFCDAVTRGEKPDARALPPEVLAAARVEWAERAKRAQVAV